MSVQPYAVTWHKLPTEVVGMATRNVVLTEHHEALIASLLEAGRYQNASEVLRDGLRLLEREHREFEVRLESLRRAAQRGWDDIDSGRYFDASTDDERAMLWDDIDRRVEILRDPKAPKAG